MKIADIVNLIGKTKIAGKCWGIRLNADGEIYVFYHPWGCEGETDLTGKTARDILQAIEKINIED